ncbi:hypothetical protein ZOSMA_1G03670 [Zostera marina]|uniref:Tubby C-terminal domain-containing protein n=1 Tax=Zostera marina TaxID=29655 RepID=A0A0K9PN38_ZOSMR|nr:hypothetical protein ZOSMA_1G03670 [Zostera marina]
MSNLVRAAVKLAWLCSKFVCENYKRRKLQPKCDGKLATIHGRWQVFKGGTDDLENLLYEVMKCNMIQFTNEYKVFLAGNSKEENFDFLIKHVNNAGSYSVNIGDSGEIIARIHKERNAYGVTIYPFVDYAFVISLIAILYVIDN